MLVAVVSSKGSPGGSTSALAMALTWPRPVILAELDSRGGDVIWGYGRGQNIGPSGLLRLQMAASRRATSSELLWNEVVELPGGGQRWFLPGLNQSRESGSVNWGTVVRALRAVEGVDVIADCGATFVDRDRTPRPVWSAADLVALAVRPTLPGVHAAQGGAAILRADLMSTGFGPDRLRAFVVACRHGYDRKKLAPELADLAPVLDEVVPYDPGSADVLSGLRDQGRRFVSKSPLMRSAATLGLEMGRMAEGFATSPLSAVGEQQSADRRQVGQNPTLTPGPLVPPRTPPAAPAVARGVMPAAKLGSHVAPRRDPAPMHLRADSDVQGRDER